MNTRYTVAVLLGIVALAVFSMAFSFEKGIKIADPVAEAGGINWLTFEQVQEKIKEEPKKVFVDIYTNWCGPCKVMSNTTLKDPEIVKYLNENYYSIKFNAETPDTIVFKGKTYTNKKYVPNKPGRNGTHDLTYKIGPTQRGIVYPTTVYFDEDFNILTAVAGSLQKQTLNTVIHWFGTNSHLTTKWEDYEKQFNNKENAPTTN